MRQSKRIKQPATTVNIVQHCSSFRITVRVSPAIKWNFSASLQRHVVSLCVKQYTDSTKAVTSCFIWCFLFYRTMRNHPNCHIFIIIHCSKEVWIKNVTPLTCTNWPLAMARSIIMALSAMNSSTLLYTRPRLALAAFSWSNLPCIPVHPNPSKQKFPICSG